MTLSIPPNIWRVTCESWLCFLWVLAVLPVSPGRVTCESWPCYLWVLAVLYLWVLVVLPGSVTCESWLCYLWVLAVLPVSPGRLSRGSSEWTARERTVAVSGGSHVSPPGAAWGRALYDRLVGREDCYRQKILLNTRGNVSHIAEQKKRKQCPLSIKLLFLLDTFVYFKKNYAPWYWLSGVTLSLRGHPDSERWWE